MWCSRPVCRDVRTMEGLFQVGHLHTIPPTDRAELILHRNAWFPSVSMPIGYLPQLVVRLTRVLLVDEKLSTYGTHSRSSSYVASSRSRLMVHRSEPSSSRGS